MKTYPFFLFCFLLFPISLIAQNELISFGSTWQYLDDGSDQGTAWSFPSFSDEDWNNGPGKFGYGESAITTVINYGPDAKQKNTTTYFRKTVIVPDASAFSSYLASAHFDDGVVVYVNGIEVYRYNLPEGVISYTTLASSADDNGSDALLFTISGFAFVTGTNVIAVEVHQSKPNTSDMIFDLELTGIEGAPVPVDDTPPIVQTIQRQAPLSETTAAIPVTFRATFSEGVRGVSSDDFIPIATSGTLSDTVAAVAAVGVDGTTYDVTVNSITGEGDLRLDLHNIGTGITDASGNAISGGYTGGEAYTIYHVGFTSVVDLEPLTVSKNTGEKPQSKVWMHDGKHWTVMPDNDGTHIWRLDSTTWTKVLTLVSSSSTKADCKVMGDVVHILLFRGSSTSYVVSAEYVPESSTYQAWTQRPSRSGITLGSETEAATMDIDGTGRMWIAYEGVNDVNVRWSDSPYTTWSAPITLATDITDDDICVVIAMSGTVGVLWSNQNTKRFGFRTHADGAEPADWSADEVPASQSALDIRYGIADDHMNMAVATDGTVYCAVKTGYDTPGYTKLGLLVRRPTGTWDDLYQVTDAEGTRPVVILNEAIGKLKVIYTDDESGGNIVYKESSTSSIPFSPALALIKGLYNKATSIKSNYSSEVVILASNSEQAVGVLATDAAPDITLEASSIAASVATLAGRPIVKQEAMQDELQVYPNPLSEKGIIHFALARESEYTLSLYDSKGELLAGIRQGKIAASQKQVAEIDCLPLKSGLYFIRLQTAWNVRVLRLIVEK